MINLFWIWITVLCTCACLFILEFLRSRHLERGKRILRTNRFFSFNLGMFLGVSFPRTGFSIAEIFVFVVLLIIAVAWILKGYTFRQGKQTLQSFRKEIILSVFLMAVLSYFGFSSSYSDCLSPVVFYGQLCPTLFNPHIIDNLIFVASPFMLLFFLSLLSEYLASRWFKKI